ncbi:MAG: hypothetical protein RLZZ225_256, partial [Pseudomonadota bacterium]
FTKKEFDLNKRNLIAKILLIIIDNNNLKVEKINLIKEFNKYLNTRDNYELNNFIKELDGWRFSKQVCSARGIQTLKEVANSLKKIKAHRKIKTRTINFDLNGIEFCVEDKLNQQARMFSEEIKRLARINVEEINLVVEDRLNHEELILLKEFKHLANINLDEIKSISKNSLVEKYSLAENNELLYAKLWGRIESIEKSGKIRADKITKRKITKKISINEQRKRLLENLLTPIRNKIEEFNAEKINVVKGAYFSLPRFEENNNKLLDYINFKDFKKLISEAKKIFLSIQEMLIILRKIDNFYCELNYQKNYSEYFVEEIFKFNEIFNKESIVNFLENAIELFIAHELYQKKIIRIDFLRLNNKFEKITFDSQAILDAFIYSNRLKFIIERQKKEIEAYLSSYLSQDIFFDDKIDENKLYYDNIFKFIFEKIKRFVMNFSRNYFLSRRGKLDFLSQLKKNVTGALTFNSVNDFIVKLKWWHLIFYGINPFCMYKKEFKKKLSEQLFLTWIEDDFKKLIHRLEKATDHAERIQYTDELSAIINRLKSLERNDRDNIGEKSKSRYELIDELEEDVVKELTEKLFALKQQANLYLSQFSKLSSLSKKAVETLAQIKKEGSHVSTCSENNFYFFNWLQRQDERAGINSQTPCSNRAAL